MHYYNRKMMEDKTTLPYSVVTDAMDDFKHVQYNFLTANAQRPPGELSPQERALLKSPDTAPLLEPEEDEPDPPPEPDPPRPNAKKRGRTVTATDRTLRSSKIQIPVYCRG